MIHPRYMEVDSVKVRLKYAAPICGAERRFLYRVTAHHVHAGSAALPVGLDDDASICGKGRPENIGDANNFRRSLTDFNAACHQRFSLEPWRKVGLDLAFPILRAMWCGVARIGAKKISHLQGIADRCGELL